MIMTGLERLHRDPGLLRRFCGKGARVGLVANPTSVTSGFLGGAVVLARAAEACGAVLVRLFGPEHGFYGEAQAGAPIADSTDRGTGLPVVSLYGGEKRPRVETLADLDLLVYDLQDAGLRWYTYLGTLTRVIEAAAGLAAAGEKCPALLVLDRPNPLSGAVVEGMGLTPGFESLVGPRDIPARHGLTLGEYALMTGAEAGLHVEVLPMEGWNRDMFFEDCGLPWIPPSPNLPTRDSLLAYAATCLLEGTNFSEGRGTTRPFEIFGAPGVDGYRLREALDSLGIEGFRFRPLFFRPEFSKHAGSVCGGVQLYVEHRARTDFVSGGYGIVSCLRELYPGEAAPLPPWKSGGKRPMSLLSGNDMLADGVPVRELETRAGRDCLQFERKRKPFLLYT